MSTFATIDPSTGRDFEAFETTKPEQIEAALEGAHRAFRTWRTSALPDLGPHARGCRRSAPPQS